MTYFLLQKPCPWLDALWETSSEVWQRLDYSNTFCRVPHMMEWLALYGCTDTFHSNSYDFVENSRYVTSRPPQVRSVSLLHAKTIVTGGKDRKSHYWQVHHCHSASNYYFQLTFNLEVVYHYHTDYSKLPRTLLGGCNIPVGFDENSHILLVSFHQYIIRGLNAITHKDLLKWKLR